MIWKNVKKIWCDKVGKTREIKPGKIIYLDIIPQKKPIYGHYKNWILLQYSDTKQK